ncbi:MAG: aldehyde ferredoxin oxidoreductase family protein [Desulfurococcales archaeon]|nr:aldehyde ferredoxin oxidoreductase family protein [Desulfurococcales archaeon]
MHWFWGKGLLVELKGDNAEYTGFEIPWEAYRLLLGGRGLGVLVWSLHAGKTPPEPLSPDNPLVISPGALVGSGLSTASKTAFVARSPLTGLLGRSMAGGRIGWEIRRTGYDLIVVKGALDDPGILVVDNDGVRIEEAGSLWGKRIGEARGALKERHPGYADAIIGPAGENLSAISMIDAGGRQAGRTGLGAVMGSKKLKAILVKGNTPPKAADRSRVLEEAGRLNKATHEARASKALVEYGTPLMLDYTNKAYGVLPSLNWKRSTLSWCPDPERAHEELSRFAPRYRVGRNPCIGCGRPCTQVIRVGDSPSVDGPEYETVYALGSDIGICNIRDVAYLNHLADELGFDTISLGATIAWAMHAGEKGYLDGALAWGDAEEVARLVEDMAYRRGRLGALLADGSRRAADRLGAGHDLLVDVKGLEPPAYDARGLKGMALGYMVSSRGADHLTSGAYAFELYGRLWRYSSVDRLVYEGKAQLVKDGEDLMAFYDNTGICKFSRGTIYPENTAGLISALTGYSYTPGDLLLSGERTVTLERLVNLWLGLEPEVHDELPPRYYREPISDGPSSGEAVDRRVMEVLRREYYAARGWSPDGVPLASTLVRLDLAGVVPGVLLGLARSVVSG